MKSQPKSVNTEIVTGSWAEFQLVRAAFFSEYQLNISGVSVSAEDTEFRYRLDVEIPAGRSIPVNSWRAMIGFIKGVHQAFRLS